MSKDYTKSIKTAFALVALGNFADAELALKALHAENPENPDILLGLAILLIYSADYESALPLLKKAMYKKPKVARIQILLSLVLAKLHRVDEAQEFFSSIYELAPEDDRLIRVRAAILMEQGKLSEALDSLSRYALNHPDDPWDVWNDLGSLYYQQEQYEQAEEAFRFALKSAENMGLNIPFVHFNLALCCSACGRYDEAKEQLSIALESDSELAPAWAALGVLVANDEDFDRAINFVGRAIELQPENPSHWYAMAQVMELFGDHKAAERCIGEGYRVSLGQQSRIPVQDEDTA